MNTLLNATMDGTSIYSWVLNGSLLR